MLSNPAFKRSEVHPVSLSDVSLNSVPSTAPQSGAAALPDMELPRTKSPQPAISPAYLLQAITSPFGDAPPTFIGEHDRKIMLEARTDLSFCAGWSADRSPRGTAYEQVLRTGQEEGVVVLKALGRHNWDILSSKWGNLRSLRIVFSKLSSEAGKDDSHELNAAEIRSLLELTRDYVVPSSNLPAASIQIVQRFLDRLMSPDAVQTLKAALQQVPLSRKKFVPGQQSLYTRLDFVDDLLELTLYGYREHRDGQRGRKRQKA